MAEYYPLLAKAVGSLPNNTIETRRVVYERARKALIGQLRTLHPPVPDEDIERESVELDRAVERLEGELASGRMPVSPAPAAIPRSPPPVSPSVSLRPAPVRPPGGTVPTRPAPPVEGRPPSRSIEPTLPPPSGVAPDPAQPPIATGLAPLASVESASADAMPPAETSAIAPLRTRDGQRPIAPQPPPTATSRRPIWILPVGVGLIVIAVAVAAYELRDTRQGVAKVKPTEQTASGDSGKIAERVGGPASEDTPSEGRADRTAEAVGAPASGVDKDAAAAPPANPEVPVAQRAALLVEAPDEASKVKTFLGTVVWKINNVNAGPSDSVGLSVEADIDLPDDKMKAVVTFERNTDATLTASHIVRVRFAVQPGSVSGDVQQISVPQLRQEDSPSGDALAGVTVQLVQNAFLVGLSPGNAETVNLKQLRDMQWIDIPMLLSSGKIAKLTFEKGTPGQRDLSEAIAAWQKS